MKRAVSEIEEKYDLELERIVKTIKKDKAKLVMLQFPDAIKPYATAIAEKIENLTNSTCLIWLGSCFGACDIPLQVQFLKPKIDLIIQFGHAKFIKQF